MKIGILTYHRAHNYGALLQVFALTVWLRAQVKDVEIIDYWPDYHNAEYQIFPHFKTRSLKGKVKAIVYYILGLNKFIERRKGYELFIQEHLNMSDKPIYTRNEDLKSATYDLVIYGSDQIWRKNNYPCFKGFDESYFGSYVNTAKKVSYAASMGAIALQDEGDYAFLKTHLKEFDGISVREKELQEIVKIAIGHKPELVLDPVFLLDKEQWYKYLPKKKRKDKYVLLYQLKRSSESVALTNQLQQKFGCKVIEILGRVNPLKLGSRYNQTASPFEFLSIIRDADFVVSTSFHGTAFSVIFEKQFYAVGMGNNSARAKTLLSQLGISNRYLDNIHAVNFESNIDYGLVSKKLISKKKNSIDFLQRNIHE